MRHISIDGKAIKHLSADELHRARREFQMIFQDPYASLNPRMTVFATLAEPLLLHKLAKPEELVEKVKSFFLNLKV